MSKRVPVALWVATGFAAALVGVWLIAFELPFARSADADTLAGFFGLAANPRVHGLATAILHLATTGSYIALGAIFIVVAVIRRRYRVAVAVPVAMVGTSVTAEVLKALAAHVRDPSWSVPAGHISAASWPSGHAGAAMTLALCAILVSPRAMRPLVALAGGVGVIAVSYAVLVLARHFPSDVIGGFLIAGMWMSLVLAAFGWRERLWRFDRIPVEKPPRRSSGVAATGLAVAGVCAAVAREAIAPIHAPVGGSLVAGATAIALIVALCACGLVLALQGSGAEASSTAVAGYAPSV